MILLEIIAMSLLYIIWKKDTQNSYDYSQGQVLIRLLITGLAIIGGFIIAIDIIEFILDIFY